MIHYLGLLALWVCVILGALMIIDYVWTGMPREHEISLAVTFASCIALAVELG